MPWEQPGWDALTPEQQATRLADHQAQAQAAALVIRYGMPAAEPDPLPDNVTPIRPRNPR
jgi:hypothetical protein